MAGHLVSLMLTLVGIAVPFASFATGLRATDPLWLWKRPQLLVRSLLTILFAVPVVAIALAELLSPGSVLVRGGIAVSILAVGFGPPALLKRTEGPNELVSYEVGLNVVLMIVAVVYLPLAVAVHGAIFQHEAALPWASVARVVLLQALLPLAAGLAVARWLPKLATTLERHAPKLIVLTMLAVGIVAVATAFRPLVALGVGGWLTCAVVAIAATLIGHFAGGTRETRTVLAEFSALRFPALALLLASVSAQGKMLIPVVLAYVITSMLFVGVYRASAMKRAGRDVEART